MAVEALSLFDFRATSQSSTNELSHLGSLEALWSSAYVADSARVCHLVCLKGDTDTAIATD
jgi:hypothetical protein